MHSLLDALRRRGWTVRTTASRRVLLPAAVAARYAALPREVPEFLAALEVCRSADGTAWLFTAEDYAQTEEGGFRVAWPDVLVVLKDRMPEAICQAAITALDENLL